MKKLNVIGALLLLVGSLTYLFASDNISGLSRALIIGLMLGSALILTGILKED